MSNALVPEFAVTDWQTSLSFYCDILGFSCRYQRSEEGFAYLERDGAELMIDQIDQGRTFGGQYLPTEYPFGRGLNVQIRVSAIDPILASLKAANIPLFLPLEEKWYRNGDMEAGNRQFVVADPDGYLLRFYEDMGSRPVQRS
ncbi:bleomycin resistance family protein [Ochrobactrum sp. P6BS-III]|uniref:bleomycin resistance protein n=1 Tax=unclassified Ochrobactrum TaxID=239106 RepID=UPI000993EC27|nr:catechol 2,3-dioxygenase-like lactoylglutathione lyase family enzyme [Ochrobactrum sp. P6BSIII]OOL18664.1 bleomycin resistance family protein [Ochrobactrum sp. P6BS-III]